MRSECSVGQGTYVAAALLQNRRARYGGTNVDALVVAIGTAERVLVGTDDKPEMDRLLVAMRTSGACTRGRNCSSEGSGHRDNRK